jgi:hypothetical protein
LTLRKIAIIAVGNPQWPVLRLHVERVVAAVNVATAGRYAEVEIPDSLMLRLRRGAGGLRFDTAYPSFP